MAASKPHVAVLAFPFASHPDNLFTFARALAAATAPDAAAFSFFTSAKSLASLSSAPRPGNLRLCLYNDVGASSNDGGNVIGLIGEFVRAAPGNLRAAMETALRVLGHEATGVLVTHCGWNSLMESIMSRMPMVCRPFFGDHAVNARMVAEEWRIGLVIERVTAREQIVTALNVVLREEEGKRMRERAGLLNRLAAQAVADGGSSRENLKRMLEIVLRK